MNRSEAIVYLVALACCTSSKLDCNDCPLRDKECIFTEDDIFEAVRVMQEGSDDEK